MKIALWIGLVFLIDQISKFLVVARFELGESISIFPFFHLTYVTNTGTAFGLFQGVNILFIVISLLIIAVLIFWRKNIISYGVWAKAGFILVLGGAMGNLFDRIVRGVVGDFLDFLVWPVFNIADTSICIGTVLLAFFCAGDKKGSQQAGDVN